MERFQQLMRFSIICGAMPAFLTFIVYFMFVSAMTGNVYNPEAFSTVYDHGIFEYRVLGIFLLRAVVGAISTFNLPETAPDLLMQSFPETITDWFTAFFYLNLFMLSATMAVLFVAMEAMRNGKPAFFMDMTLVALLLIMMISQYIIVPYDMLSYFFLAIAMYFMFVRPNTWLNLVMICATVALATLTRETAALILSLYAAVHLSKMFQWPLRWEKELPHIFTLAAMTATFLVIYIVLRLLIETDQEFFASYRAHWNFTARLSLVGFFFFWMWVAFALTYREARTTVAVYILAAAPYIVAISLIANPREIRLWVPLILSMIILQYRAVCAKPA